MLGDWNCPFFGTWVVSLGSDAGTGVAAPGTPPPRNGLWTLPPTHFSMWHSFPSVCGESLVWAAPRGAPGCAHGPCHAETHGPMRRTQELIKTENSVGLCGRGDD